jgi:transglutaminase-like putative cysteine protease
MDEAQTRTGRAAAVAGSPSGRAFILVLAFLMPWSHLARAAGSSTSSAPPSAWVKPLNFQRADHPEDADSGLESRLLLEDRQINVASNETFLHFTRQILTSEGVQNHSIIKVDLDPVHQSLVFHWVKIIRGTNSLNRLALSQVQVTQPERNLDQFLFDGRQFAVLPLEDVRPGDILDYALTLRGDEPVAAGKYTGSVPAQRHEPADRLTTRLVWPQGRHLYTKNHGTEAAPVLVKKGGDTEFTWDFRDVSGLEEEEPLPVWYDPQPWVQLSEFPRWSEVNRWALTLFTNATTNSPELARQINVWRQLPDPEQKILASLRFVQEEIRYMGVESGSNAYTPSSPSSVFARRFGDCKDKTLLYVTILRALGVAAAPVLVSTGHRKTLQDWHPTPAAFDHAIVQVVLDGQTYWLDPTATYQRGPLSLRSWPGFGRGLVVRPGTTELAVIPESTVLPKTTVTDYFFVRVITQPTDLKIVTVAEGPDAERLRRQFASTGRPALVAQYLNDHAEFYPDITTAAPLEFQDDQEANQVTVTEYYQLGKFWTRSAPGAAVVFRFISENIDRALRKPKVFFRSMPLGQTYPEHQVCRLDITVPGAVNLELGNKTVENLAFHFHKTAGATYRHIWAEEEYATLTDAVPTEVMPDYLLELDRVFDMLDLTVFAYY